MSANGEGGNDLQANYPRSNEFAANIWVSPEQNTTRPAGTVEPRRSSVRPSPASVPPSDSANPTGTEMLPSYTSKEPTTPASSSDTPLSAYDNASVDRQSDSGKYRPMNSTELPKSMAVYSIQTINRSTLAPPKKAARATMTTEKAENSDFRPLGSLTNEEVVKLLQSMNLNKHIPQFQTNDITGRILEEIKSVEELKECDIKLPGPVAKSFIKDMSSFKVTGVPKDLLQ